ncbi:MAG: PilX N-terminal domain-containing pilus assembly protein [Desulfobacterales bacterium]
MENEKGSVMVLAVVLLFLLALLGMAALSTSSIETQIAGNELRHELAYYAAESAAAYVAFRPDLYGPDNIRADICHYFPNNTTPYVKITTRLPPAQSISATQSFNGQVQYQSASSPPRGSGCSAGEYKAHQYTMICNGYAPDNTAERIVVGFYRIGF